MDDTKRLALIVEAVRYCQNVRQLGMPVSCYAIALREPIHYLWERRGRSKVQAAKLRSKAAAGLRFGKDELVYDHAVPFRYLQKELLSLTRVTDQSVVQVLERFATTVLITVEEDARLNAAGFGKEMPDDWDLSDPLARYKALGIELTENSEGLSPPLGEVPVLRTFEN